MKIRRWIYIALLVLLPVAYFAPNIITGGVLLPLDILYHSEPFASSAPPQVAKVHNPPLSDLVTLYYPDVVLARRSKGVAPLWNPYSFCGSPALANAQNGILFPLSWLLRLLPLGPAYLLFALGKMWFCAIFAYLFYRKLGFHSLSAFSGALGFTFAGHMMAWFGYPTSLALCSWPFFFWSIERLLAACSLSSVGWLSIAFGLLFIGGQPQTGFLIAAAGALYLTVRNLDTGIVRYRIWAAYAVAGALGLCLAAPQILPFLEYLRTSTAAVMRGDYGRYGWKYYAWYTFLSWIMPRFFGDVRTGNFWGFSSFLGEAVYIGALPLVFAGLAFVVRQKHRNFFKAASAVFLFGGLGLYVRPLGGLYAGLPFLGSIDNNKLIALVTFGLISYSVLGFETLLAGASNVRRLVSLWAWIACAWMAFAGFGVFYFRDAFRDMNLWGYEWREACWMAAILAAGTVVLWLARRGVIPIRSAAVLILCITVMDLFRVWLHYYPSYPEEYLVPKSEAVSYLQRNAGNDRIMGLGEILTPEISVLFHLQDTRGYDGMTPYAYYQVLAKLDPNVRDLWRKLQISEPPGRKWVPATLGFKSFHHYLHGNDPKVAADLSRIDYWSNGISETRRPALLSILGVRFLLAPKGSPVPQNADLHLVHSSDADVWENPHALPRAFVVTRPTPAKDDDEALALISAPDFAFERTAVITAQASADTPIKEQTQSPGRLIPAEIRRYDPEYVEITANSPERGWLILSDLHYPGWQAFCDGRPVEIVRGNYMFRAVALAAGPHAVTFVYRPSSFRLGLLLAAIAAVCIIALASWTTLSRRKRS